MAVVGSDPAALAESNGCGLGWLDRLLATGGVGVTPLTSKNNNETKIRKICKNTYTIRNLKKKKMPKDVAPSSVVCSRKAMTKSLRISVSLSSIRRNRLLNNIRWAKRPCRWLCNPRRSNSRKCRWYRWATTWNSKRWIFLKTVSYVAGNSWAYEIKIRRQTNFRIPLKIKKQPISKRELPWRSP